jgi:tRNA (adenine57-N1/adenine58-N1)-methyltransferase
LIWNYLKDYACEGDLVQLIGRSHQYFIVRLKSGSEFQSHRGVIKHDDLIGLQWGSQVLSHKGNPFYLMQPSLADVLKDIPRTSQILYPKDIGFILISMDIGPGKRVVEAGTGSGAFTTALAYAVGSEGMVYSYDVRPDIQKIAISNVAQLGMTDRVVFKQRDISDGFDEQGVDALFLDLPNPHDYLGPSRDALKAGGFLGGILPTANQMTLLLTALYRYDFAFVEVCEIMLRYYKTEPTRFRPSDRMVAHTGFLYFARPIIKNDTVDEQSGKDITEKDQEQDRS